MKRGHLPNIWNALGALLCAATLLGCGSDSSGPRYVNGSYTLRTVRGEQLPATLHSTPDNTLQITGGTITISGDLTFEDSYTFREYGIAGATTTTINCSGRWEPDGQYMNLQESATAGCGGSGIGEWNGNNQLTVAWDFGTAVHRR